MKCGPVSSAYEVMPTSCVVTTSGGCLERLIDGCEDRESCPSGGNLTSNLFHANIVCISHFPAKTRTRSFFLLGCLLPVVV